MNEIKSILASEGVRQEPRALYSTDRGEVLGFDGPGGDAAIRLWERLRAASAETGYWPVLLGGPDEKPEMVWLDTLVGQAGDLAERHRPRVLETLAAAATLRLPEWFEERHRERLEDLQDFGEPDSLFAPEGEWPDDVEASRGWSTPFDRLRRRPYQSLAYALVPTTVGWEVPAFLNLGGWNECPGAAEHCAVMKYWHDRYGAEVAASTHDVIEMRVGRPPTERSAALALAREQYEYCADIVEQGTQTLAALAACLLRGSVWFFWWD